MIFQILTPLAKNCFFKIIRMLDNLISKVNILFYNLFGFQKGRSTAMAMMHVIEEISSCLDNKKSTIGIFIDLKNAFYAIDHEIFYQNYIIIASED